VYHVNHHIIDAFRTVNPGTPFLFLFAIAIFAKLDHHYKFGKRFGGKSRLKEIQAKLKS